MALTWDALVCGCIPNPVMLVATPMTSVQPSSETISNRMRRDERKLSNENVVDGDGFAHTRGTGNGNAVPSSPTTLFVNSFTQSRVPPTEVSLHVFVWPAKMLRPQTA